MDKVKIVQNTSLVNLPLRPQQSKQCLEFLREHKERCEELVVIPFPMTLSDFAVKYTLQNMTKND